MGGGGRSRTQRKHFNEKRENVWKRRKSENPDNDNKNNGNDTQTGGWEPYATQNPAFNDYYTEQRIVLPEEWDKFMQVLRKPLPSAFRVNSSSQFCANTRSQLENDFMKSLEAEVTDEGELEGIRPLPWYPENLAWQSNYSRMQLRKNKTLERFHEFLKQENEIGNITRQEAVSMVPPLFLDVRPDHYILDMCAAPGSKTFQLLEMMHQSCKPGILPAGMVVANDVDVQRCNLLIHQTKRMCTANLIVANHEAQNFPSCRLKKNCSIASEVGNFEESSANKLLFDRVLCDVPCSGDGTLRKAPDIWRKWNVGMGNGIHSLQLKIAMRGISLLKVGGKMVYSTCSMNPVENEAVVAEILRRCDGSVELVDISSELPQLIRRPGLKTWKVRDKGTWSASYKDVPQFRRGGIFPSMFPSGKSYDENPIENDDNGDAENETQPADNSVEVCDLPLQHCMRIVPHDQNTGAFFIAVLHKISALSGISENSEPLQKSSDAIIEDSTTLGSNPADTTDSKITEPALDSSVLDNGSLEDTLKEDQVCNSTENFPEKTGQKRKLQFQGKWRGVDPVVFFKDETLLEKIKTFYGIADSFPFDGHLVTRSSDTNHAKRIYYISKSVKETLQLNFLVGQQLKITSIGLKMFERQTSKEGTASPCSFRVSSEGLPLILPYITKQILSASLVDFKHMLQYKSIKFSDFVDADFGDKASKLLMGCCILILRKDDKTLSDSIQVDASTIAIGCWRGRGSLTVMVTSVECQELLERHLGEANTEKNTPVNGEEKYTHDPEMNKNDDAVELVNEN